jgi:glycosyltransferase involved in cell wall biosynthesis
MTTIHQFVPVISHGDGVSGSAFYIQTLLRSLGYASEIYAWKSADALSDEVFPLNRFDSNRCDLLLVHHSMGHEQEDWLRATTCKRILVYHNITPSRYFSPGSNEYFYAIKGREQLRQWRPLFASAISVSPYNRTDLEDAGYDDTVVMPLLLDVQRFEGDVEPPSASWRRRENEILIVSVGRLVENKRQHVLLDAFWHLRKIHPERPARLVLVGGITSPAYHHQILARICELGLEHEVTLTGKCPDAQLRWLYKHATLMWCASEHEGFCIPLVEANFFCLPVVSFATSNIPDTLGESGLLIDDSNPITMAATTVSLLKDKALSQSLVRAGTENLQRYNADTLMPRLRNYLETRDIRP